MSKRSVAYVKPEEPSFLRDLKIQAGYKEGPTVDTKRQEFGDSGPEDYDDNNEEEPTVVVLGPGDLTAEEAAREKEHLEKATAEEKADLSAPIVFKSKKLEEKLQEPSVAKKHSFEKSEPDSKKSKRQKTQAAKSLLSFNDDEEEDED